MLDHFVSTSSVSRQCLVLESPLFQVIFMKNHAKNPLFEGLCYNLKGLELFSKTNFESSWMWGAENLIDYVFCATLLVSGINFFVPPPLKYFGRFIKRVSCIWGFPTGNKSVFRTTGGRGWIIFCALLKPNGYTKFSDSIQNRRRLPLIAEL